MVEKIQRTYAHHLQLPLPQLALQLAFHVFLCLMRSRDRGHCKVCAYFLKREISVKNVIALHLEGALADGTSCF